MTEQTPTQVDIYNLGIYTKQLVLWTVHASVDISGEGNVPDVGIVNSKTIDTEVHFRGRLFFAINFLKKGASHSKRRIIKSLYRIMVICFLTFLVPLRPHPREKVCRLDTRLYFVCRLVGLFVCLSVCQSGRLSVCLSVCMAVGYSFFLFLAPSTPLQLLAI